MPCRDGMEDFRRSEEYAERALIRAALCAVLTALERESGGDLYENVLSFIDWKEAGVTEKEFRKWWKDHKMEDAERRAYEREERRKEEVRKFALSKLSDEEKKILGVK